MITREKLIEILTDRSKNSYTEKGVDHQMKALTLLRERIPYDVCGSIIVAAEHDKIYLCNEEDLLHYISEDDAKVLQDCNLVFDEELDCLTMFA